MTAEEWSAKAVVRMITSDNVLRQMEWKSLKLSIQKKASSLLGLNQAFISKIIEWADGQAKLNKVEKELYELAKKE